VGIGQRLTLVGINDEVLADRHGIALDVFGYAFGVTRLEFESKGLG